MSFFSSDRERRLWLWLAVVLAGIYATLGRAPQIAAALRARNDLRDSLFFALFVALVVVTILFVRKRPGRAESAVGIGIVVVYVAAWLRIGTLEERTHLFEYGLVAALVHEALIERWQNGRLPLQPTIPALLISFLLGWLDEAIQAILPNRVYDIRDVFFNAVAVVMIIGARWLLATVRQWAQTRRKETGKNEYEEK